VDFQRTAPHQFLLSLNIIPHFSFVMWIFGKIFAFCVNQNGWRMASGLEVVSLNHVIFFSVTNLGVICHLCDPFLDDVRF